MLIKILEEEEKIINLVCPNIYFESFLKSFVYFLNKTDVKFDLTSLTARNLINWRLKNPKIFYIFFVISSMLFKIRVQFI